MKFYKFSTGAIVNIEEISHVTNVSIYTNENEPAEPTSTLFPMYAKKNTTTTITKHFAEYKIYFKNGQKAIHNSSTTDHTQHIEFINDYNTFCDCLMFENNKVLECY